ncbi:MAG: hypothetical protein HON62_11320 [Rhodospirillaceae bacterium]|nr:hypothetical protein [Rhodospirillaceae bacterium]
MNRQHFRNIYFAVDHSFRGSRNETRPNIRVNRGRIVPDEIGLNHAALGGDLNPNVRADMTFFETPGGGAVFSVGSIAWPGSLPHNGYDNNVSRICENVLGRFVDDTPFAMPDG